MTCAVISKAQFLITIRINIFFQAVDIAGI